MIEIFNLDFRKGSLITKSGIACTPADIAFKNSGRGYGAYFNNTTSKIDTGSDWIGTKATTICAWIKAYGWGEGLSGTFSYVLTNNKYYIAIWSGQTCVAVTTKLGGTLGVSATGSVVLNKNIFIAVTTTAAGVVNIYLADDKTAPTLSGVANQILDTPENGTTNVFLGNNSLANSTFDGLIPIVKGYEGILNLATITQLWSNSLNYIR